MKSAKEILRALNACSEEKTNCRKCSYYIGCADCIRDLMVDAEKLIEYLLANKQQKDEQK